MITKRKLITIIIGIEIVMIVAVIVFLFYHNSDTVKINRQLELAQRYLLEEDYEQAIAAFEIIIEIDPKNVDAYLGLAEAYVSADELGNAVRTLEKATEQTDSEEVLEMLEAQNAEIEKRQLAAQRATEAAALVMSETTNSRTEETEQNKTYQVMPEAVLESMSYPEPVNDMESQMDNHSEQKDEKAYIEEYKRKLRELKKGDSGPVESRFALVYVDDDEIPELVVIECDAHSDGGELYTYCNNEVTYLGTYGTWGYFGYAPGTGFIFSGWMGQGFYTTTVHQLSNGNVIDLYSLQRDESAYQIDKTNKIVYYINDNEVSQEEYEEKDLELTALYEMENRISYSDLPPVTEENLSKYIQ